MATDEHSSGHSEGGSDDSHAAVDDYGCSDWVERSEDVQIGVEVVVFDWTVGRDGDPAGVARPERGALRVSRVLFSRGQGGMETDLW